MQQQQTEVMKILYLVRDYQNQRNHMRCSSIVNLIPQNNVTKESVSKLEKRFPHEGLHVTTLPKISDGGYFFIFSTFLKLFTDMKW
jgi:hypothetical protein